MVWDIKEPLSISYVYVECDVKNPILKLVLEIDDRVSVYIIIIAIRIYIAINELHRDVTPQSIIPWDGKVVILSLFSVST